MQLLYRLTSPSGKVYIGQTKNFSSRMSTYRNLKCKQQAKLYRSLLKHGFDQHEVCILHRFSKPVSQAMMDNFERYAIKLFGSIKGVELLNLTEGGRGNGHRGPQPRTMLRVDVRGERHRLARLTADDVRAMRAVYVKGSRGLGIRQLSEHFGVSQRLVYNIVNHKTWKHIEGVTNSGDLATTLRARLQAETERRARCRYGPLAVLDQCQATKFSGERCRNRATRGSTCGSHSIEFRQFQRVLSKQTASNIARERGRFCGS